MTLARALSHRTEQGKHYGIITAKFVAVLEALLWGFHNAATGRCFPSYETIADRAGCARSTVYDALRALEDAGILTWVNRITRIREMGVDLFGKAANRWRVIRTSNAYAFIDPNPSKSEFKTGTTVQELNLSPPSTPQPPLDPHNPLHASLLRLGRAIRGD
jgi:DNA-binding transcriptional MocR family regulator